MRKLKKPVFTGIAIQGASIDSIKEAQKAVLAILATPVADNVKIWVCRALLRNLSPHHSTITGCHIQQ